MRPNSTPKAKRINASKWCKKVDEEKMRAKKKTILFWKRKKAFLFHFLEFNLQRRKEST
jgi:hypothetical protein